MAQKININVVISQELRNLRRPVADLGTNMLLGSHNPDSEALLSNPADHTRVEHTEIYIRQDGSRPVRLIALTLASFSGLFHLGQLKIAQEITVHLTSTGDVYFSLCSYFPDGAVDRPMYQCFRAEPQSIQLRLNNWFSVIFSRLSSTAANGEETIPAPLIFVRWFHEITAHTLDQKGAQSERNKKCLL